MEQAVERGTRRAEQMVGCAIRFPRAPAAQCMPRRTAAKRRATASRCRLRMRANTDEPPGLRTSKPAHPRPDPGMRATACDSHGLPCPIIRAPVRRHRERKPRIKMIEPIRLIMGFQDDLEFVDAPEEAAASGQPPVASSLSPVADTACATAARGAAAASSAAAKVDALGACACAAGTGAPRA